MSHLKGCRQGGLSSFTNCCIPATGAAIAAAAAAATILAPAAVVRADSIGLDQLRALDPTLNGSGVRVAQVEAGGTNTVLSFEVNPNAGNVNQPSLPFTYYSTNGIATSFNNGNNAAGSESGHADFVAQRFYGIPAGVATNVAQVDNYEADYFVNNVIAARDSGALPASVINQSFAFADDNGNLIQDPNVDQLYDNFVALGHLNKIFVSATGNSGGPASPSTMYNGIAVGAYGGATATGPTTDGRSKPDIVAPEGETSYAAPQVAGAAAILVQAGARGDAGVSNESATQDFRVVKALLLNGAAKPADWTHTQTQPLDPRYGAGVLNVYNSYQQLHAGRQSFTTTTTNTQGGSHAPPTGVVGNEASNVGWAFDTLTSGTSTDAVGHYFFNVTGASGLTATLDWERPASASDEIHTTPNNLDLFLYNVTTGQLIDQSISTVDNVEHLYDPTLPAGRYDLEVLLHGVSGTSLSQTYGLAYDFAATPEPAAGLMLLAGGSALQMRRRKRKVG